MKEKGMQDLGLDIDKNVLSDLTIQEEVNRMTDRLMSEIDFECSTQAEYDIKSETPNLITIYSGSKDKDGFKKKLSELFNRLKRRYQGE